MQFILHALFETTLIVSIKPQLQFYSIPALPTVEVVYSFRRDVSQITPELGTSIRLQ